ncbi:helix-turn-helix transcriptional regulator [Brevibacillus humidisoli]|uniref:helix-turn-helix transcriptional regulator n=1 Tax=Brevibacillus humidisoli TaxID=2895522 RepID=UPI001E3353F8|nr:helix-turn-helix transcriptional regulator [Brevibacillus humidisoli]UFJ39598.1 helix-turn-helix transcriptional regulator [Brevibacillus humidisoli]
MIKEVSYTTEEVARLLRVSKLTVYDLIKKGELVAYRVGRQMRIDAADLDAYKSRAKKGPAESLPSSEKQDGAVGTVSLPANQRPLVISGQDMALDILARHVEARDSNSQPLRSQLGSLNGLIAMYQGACEVASTHLYDADTEEYNLPYIRKLLSGHRYLVVNLAFRHAGFYVAKGNPKAIGDWRDLGHPDIRMINREKGSGIRVLVDEQLRVHKLDASRIIGYDQEETNHLGVAGAVANGRADAGVGIEKAAYVVGVDFVPLIKERYDLVLLKKPDNAARIELLLDILRSKRFQNEIASIGGYDLSLTGSVLLET